MNLQSAIVLLGNIIVNTYFDHFHCVWIISEKGYDYIGHIPVVLNCGDDEQISRDIAFGCQGIVLHVDDPLQLFLKIEEELKVGTTRLNTRHYLVLPTEDSDSGLEIFNTTNAHFIPDILVVTFGDETWGNWSVLHTENYTFDLKTHRFVGLDENDDVYLIDSWNSETARFSHAAKLYPDKISDMQGRTLNFATFDYRPYAIVENGNVDGTETRSVLEYCQKHNCTPHFVIDQEHEWGEIFDNWTGNGILGNVATDEADIGFGALYTWYHEYNFLDLSMPIVRTGITCLAPTPRLLAGWLFPFFPFSPKLWAATAACLILGIFSFHLVVLRMGKIKPTRNGHLETSEHLNQELGHAAVVVSGMFLLQAMSIKRLPHRAPLRCLVVSILILTLLLACTYSSGLASSMTIPRYEKAINTRKDLADSNMEWGATHDAWIFSIMAVTEEPLVTILRNFKTYDEKHLLSKTKTMNYAFSVERLPAGHFAVGTYITAEDVPNLLIMKEDIYWEQCVYMSRKSSPYMPSLNTLILRIHQAGLPAIWETLVIVAYMDYQVQIEVKVLYEKGGDTNREPVKLNLAQLQGVFALWGIGLLASALIFIMERLLHNPEIRYV